MKKQSKLLNKNAVLLVILTIFALFIVIYIGFSIYFKDRFLFGTYINNVDYSKKTVSEVEQAITNRINTYVLTIEERGENKEYIASNDIDMKAVLNMNLDEVKEKQNPFLWIAGLLKKNNYNVGVTASYDEKLLEKVFNSLECFNSENVEKPVDAHISDYTEDNGYQIVAETFGNEVDKDKFYDLVKDAIAKQETRISIEDTDSYVKPKITSDSKKLEQVLNTLNKYINTTITYEFGEVKEVVDATDISGWLEVNEDFEVVFNQDSVRQYVDYIGYTYNTFGKKRDFKTSYGKNIKVVGGDYGWWLNRSAEVDELITAVKQGGDIKKEPNYYQKAGAYGENDIGNTYVELNLKEQHLFYYKDGKLIVESDFVSGNLARGFGTPVGTYSITYKERNATLVGEDYSTPVQYWMPFNNNIGLHDASWRSRFGGELYLTQGSHGCINLPPAVAKKIYENIEKGTAVVCYELELDKAKDDSDDKEKNSFNEQESTSNNSTYEDSSDDE
jgi:hypothetical protein